ncbi:MAG TPA: hypothetical protein VEL06_02515, partial [Haliangiales bacterium]|nr:hypothetical protein [Haliangiales bacterium]
MKKLLLVCIGVQIMSLANPVYGEKPVRAAGRSVGNSGARFDDTSAIVQLQGEPLSTYAGTRPARGQKIDFDSNAVKSYRAKLVAARNDFKAWLR